MVQALRPGAIEKKQPTNYYLRALKEIIALVRSDTEAHSCRNFLTDEHLLIFPFDSERSH